MLQNSDIEQEQIGKPLNTLTKLFPPFRGNLFLDYQEDLHDKYQVLPKEQILEEMRKAKAIGSLVDGLRKNLELIDFNLDPQEFPSYALEHLSTQELKDDEYVQEVISRMAKNYSLMHQLHTKASTEGEAAVLREIFPDKSTLFRPIVKHEPIDYDQLSLRVYPFSFSVTAEAEQWIRMERDSGIGGRVIKEAPGDYKGRGTILNGPNSSSEEHETQHILFGTIFNEQDNGKVIYEEILQMLPPSGVENPDLETFKSGIKKIIDYLSEHTMDEMLGYFTDYTIPGSTHYDMDFVVFPISGMIKENQWQLLHGMLESYINRIPYEQRSQYAQIANNIYKEYNAAVDLSEQIFTKFLPHLQKETPEIDPISFMTYLSNKRMDILPAMVSLIGYTDPDQLLAEAEQQKRTRGVKTPYELCEDYFSLTDNSQIRDKAFKISLNLRSNISQFNFIYEGTPLNPKNAYKLLSLMVSELRHSWTLDDIKGMELLDLKKQLITLSALAEDKEAALIDDYDTLIRRIDEKIRINAISEPTLQTVQQAREWYIKVAQDKERIPHSEFVENSRKLFDIAFSNDQNFQSFVETMIMNLDRLIKEGNTSIGSFEPVLTSGSLFSGIITKVKKYFELNGDHQFKDLLSRFETILKVYRRGLDLEKLPGSSFEDSQFTVQ